MRLLKKVARIAVAAALLAIAIAVAAVATRNGAVAGTLPRWVMLALLVGAAAVAFPSPKELPRAGSERWTQPRH